MKYSRLKDRQLGAFTIIELMVAMVLFITIISLGMLVWNNVNNGLRRIQNESEIFYEYISLITVLEKDFNQAEEIKNVGIGLDLANDINDISYVFYPDSVVRTINSNRTKFMLRTISYELSYIKNIDVVNGIDLRFKLQGKDIISFINRSVTGKTLIKNQLENGN
jgi:type II secretory pathway pseudopilin PulG